MKQPVLTITLLAATVFITNVAYANEQTEDYRKDNTAVEQKDTNQTFTSYTGGFSIVTVNEESKDLKQRASSRRNNQTRRSSDSSLIFEYYTQGSDAIESCYEHGRYCKKAHRIENILMSMCAQRNRDACRAYNSLIQLRGMKDAQRLLEF